MRIFINFGPFFYCFLICQLLIEINKNIKSLVVILKSVKLQQWRFSNKKQSQKNENRSLNWNKMAIVRLKSMKTIFEIVFVKSQQRNTNIHRITDDCREEKKLRTPNTKKTKNSTAIKSSHPQTFKNWGGWGKGGGGQKQEKLKKYLYFFNFSFLQPLSPLRSTSRMTKHIIISFSKPEPGEREKNIFRINKSEFERWRAEIVSQTNKNKT